MRATAETVVNRPNEQVWAFISDVKSMERWVTGVSDVKAPADGKLAAGATFQSAYRYAGHTHEVTYSVTAFAPGKRIAIRSIQGPFPFKWEVGLEPAGDGTRVRHTVDAGADSLVTAIMFAVMWPLMRYGMRRGLRKDLERLKEALETTQ